MSFGERLKAARKEAGLSQTELAGNRCSVSYVSHLESGRRTPTPEMLRYFETALGVAPGSLGDASDLSGAGRRRAGDAGAVALYSEAVLSWRQGVFALAQEQAMEARSHLTVGNRSDLDLLIGALLVEIHIDLGHYQDAVTEASRHLEAARSVGSALLEARAGVLLSKAARVNGDVALAASKAADAVRLCQSAHLPLTVTVQALIAAISAGHVDSAVYARELEESSAALEDSPTRGLAEWVLGNVAWHSGDVEAGKAAHDRANQLLSPTADFRNWARFPRVAAEERLQAGCEDGVAELLREAKSRLDLLESADELATLAIVRARFARAQGHVDEALDDIRAALEDADLPPSTQGRLYLAAAHAYGEQGDMTQATAVALQAARRFTEAGDVNQARTAWEFVDETAQAAEQANA
ncbi:MULTISPECIES: helix-turn-helix domain-containing protein [Dermacoccus]|uniref:helix-turn-helix domain-containing protein n=1 Tax=Dermacoccus TaxID=57495 RepID=UPI000938C664|nr:MULTISPECIES: helix-turn-helix transcriptional regulator [Dermacoccus]